MGLSIYVHEGNGHWIGSAVVCLARSDEEAASIVRKYLDDNGLPKEPLNIRQAQDYEPGLIYAVNGDY